MTKKWKGRIVCEHCGQITTAESAFERWMRNNDHLDSQRFAVVRFDLDVLLHRYMLVEDGKGTRNVQAAMFIEVKAFGAECSEAQRDTLNMINQVFRNRQITGHARPRPQMGGQPRKVWSTLHGRWVTLRLYGGHLLQMSKASPVDGPMIWDRKHEIEVADLEALLRFERDPDSPSRPADWRRRSKPFRTMATLFSEKILKML